MDVTQLSTYRIAFNLQGPAISPTTWLVSALTAKWPVDVIEVDTFYGPYAEAVIRWRGLAGTIEIGDVVRPALAVPQPGESPPIAVVANVAPTTDVAAGRWDSEDVGRLVVAAALVSAAWWYTRARAG